MRILFLDDDKVRHDAFAKQFAHDDRVHVTNYADFEIALAGDKFDGIFLDHDLNDFGRNSVISDGGMYGSHYDYELTGVDAARLIVRLPAEKIPGTVVVHSWNPGGADNIANILRDAGINVARAPFSYSES